MSAAAAVDEAAAAAAADHQQQPDDGDDPQGTLDPNSYTAHRLHHATPEHLHVTTRRVFVGPIPVGWLKNHRSEWYKHHLHVNYSSKESSFAKDDNVGFRRKVTGLGESAGVVESWRPAGGTAEEVLLEDDEEEEYLEEEEEEEGGEDDEDAETPIPLSGKTAVGRNSGPVPIPRAAASDKR